MEKIKRFFKEEEGITFAETGLYLAIVTLVAALGLTLMGTNMRTFFNTIAGRLVAP